MRRLGFTILYRGQLVELDFADDRVRVASQTTSGIPISIGLDEALTELRAGGRLELPVPAAPA